MAIHENMKDEKAICICPECKNTVDMSRYPTLNTGMVIECNHCGMTLLVKNIKEGKVDTEIVDQGK